MDILSNIDTIFGVLGVVFGVFSFLYYRKIKFYMFVSKIFKFHKTTEITVSNKFSTENKITLKSIRSLLKSENFTIMNANDNNIIINMNDFIVEFKKDDFPIEDYGENSIIKMTMTRTYYRQARNSIDKFINLCECFHDDNAIENSIYNLKINYHNIKNPYLSFSAHRINEKNIKNLIMKVDTAFLVDGLNEEVFINKESLSYSSKSSKNIYKIANDFMII